MNVSVQLESAENMRLAPAQTHGSDHLPPSRGYFYTLPKRLLKSIVKNVGRDCFDAGQLESEFALSNTVGDHGYSAGYLNGNVFKYEFLGGRRPLKISESAAQRLGITMESARQLEVVGSQRLDTFGIPVRGYAGWLAT